MGCFSWKCSGCGDPINSNSVEGEHATLFLIKDDFILEKMTGQYDSYGAVFNSDRKGAYKWTSMDWNAIVDMDCESDPTSGIAAYHSGCYDAAEHPVHSEGDPEQGWGDFKHTTEGVSSHYVFKTPLPPKTHQAFSVKALSKKDEQRARRLIAAQATLAVLAKNAEGVRKQLDDLASDCDEFPDAEVLIRSIMRAHDASIAAERLIDDAFSDACDAVVELD